MCGPHANGRLSERPQSGSGNNLIGYDAANNGVLDKPRKKMNFFSGRCHFQGFLRSTYQ